jgi:hypothetical protein
VGALALDVAGLISTFHDGGPESVEIKFKTTA